MSYIQKQSYSLCDAINFQKGVLLVQYSSKRISGKHNSRHTVPMCVPFGQTDGAMLAINFSIVITR